MDTERSPLVWEEGAPRSALYGDIYFSLEDGLAESRAVFLQGCGLPAGWRGKDAFTVAELGFGSGLNICALLELWRRTRPPGARLTVFSIEAHPIAREDAARALAAFPEVAEAAGLLLEQWPPQSPGVHRIDLQSLGAVVAIAVAEVADALRNWEGRADAWFLDGFSPALNPAMWRDEVLDLVAARSRPGARLATFTVAGAVRRGLANRGFAVEKMPGFGRKRQRLEARLPGAATLILGSGIAGASLARAFAALGCPVAVFEDPETPPASGNPAALVTPALDAGGGARAAFYAQAFARAVELYAQVPGALIDSGAYQLETEARDDARFDKIAAQNLWAKGAVQRVSAADAAAALDEPAGAGGLLFRDGLVVDPAVIRKAWTPDVRAGRAVAIEPREEGWAVIFEDGAVKIAARVIIASGYAAARLMPGGPSITPVRGQASLAEGVVSKASTFGAYAIPTKSGVLFGATHDRGEEGVEVRAGDHARNLAALAKGRPNLAARIEGLALSGRAAVRATTSDRMPLAGELEPGLFILTGLGSRGFTTAPLLAEHVAALAEGRPSPLQDGLAATVSANRFVHL